MSTVRIEPWTFFCVDQGDKLRIRHAFSIWLIAIGSIAPGVCIASDAAAARFEAIRDDPVALRRFLYRMPKGGDLHNHLDGAIYAENYIAWAAADGKCVDLATSFIVRPPCDANEGRPPASQIHYNADLVNPLIDALSVRNFERREVSGHNQFFSTFRRFYQASVGREGDMLAEVATRAARQNTVYLELMQSWGMIEAREIGRMDERLSEPESIAAIADHPDIRGLAGRVITMTDRSESRWRELANCEQDAASVGCEVEIRYLAQVIRVFPRAQVLAQTLLAAMLVEQDPRYVGINFVAPEDNPVSLRDHRWQMQLIADLSMHFPAMADGITLHAGELAPGLVPPEHLGRHIREAVEIAGAGRIGHGVDILHDADAEALLRSMAERQIMVEINLTSNDVILGISGDRHPFNLYRRHDVPLALSTDDEGVSRIDLTHEYQRVTETFDISYADLKRFSRNALHYSFLPGEPLYDDTNDAHRVAACARDRTTARAASAGCSEFLQQNRKAALQWELEKRFQAFEATFE